jgi:hypothetical protein
MTVYSEKFHSNYNWLSNHLRFSTLNFGQLIVWWYIYDLMLDEMTSQDGNNFPLAMKYMQGKKRKALNINVFSMLIG